MDEPLSNLDAKLRVQTRAEISKLHQRLKTTFIYVTHDQTEAMTMGTRIAVMKDGVLQQLDTPQNLYDNPANMFVAGFIGSPSMNFFEATVGRGNGGLVVDVGAFNLPVPASHAAQLDAYVGKQVYFGIRPENIHDAHYVPRGVEENAVMKANVTVREPLGSEVYAFVENGGKEMVSRLDPRTGAAIGQSIDLVVDMSKLHVFDRDSEKAII
jgi:multiple sugar transport system ATP-binding protein